MIFKLQLFLFFQNFLEIYMKVFPVTVRVYIFLTMRFLSVEILHLKNIRFESHIHKLF